MSSDPSTHDLPIAPSVPDLSDQIECSTELIGRGGYGSVYKGRLLRTAAITIPTAVAIKVIDLVPLKDEEKRKKRFKKITRELSLWCKIQHKNVLSLLGIARINSDTNIPAFVCPWMENGNAKEFCASNPRFPPALILYDIVNGLDYLHTLQPEIVHGDIKAVNVLINNRCEACLCDFGLSRFLIDSTLWKTTATHADGTVRWMAPELIDGDASMPSKESDIYAFAMTCYEILSGDVPFKSISNDMAIPIKVAKGLRPDRMKSVHSDFMWNIITRCWEQEPKKRLTTESVLELLRGKVDWKETEEMITKMEENNRALARMEREMAVLKEQMAATSAKAEEDTKALDKAEDVLDAKVEGNRAAWAKAEEEEKVLRRANESGEGRIAKEEYCEEKRDGKDEEKIAQLDAEVAHLSHILAEMTTALSSSDEVAAKREQLIHGLLNTNQQLREQIKEMKMTTVCNVDTISVKEVMGSVRMLNDQIEEVSSLITDSLFDQKLTSIGTEPEIEWDGLDHFIGSWLYDDLMGRSEGPITEFDPFIAQITLQTGLVNVCSRLINDWNPPFWADNLKFSDTYNRVGETEGQVAIDAWRALWRSHMTVMQSAQQEPNEKYLMEVLLKLITAVGGTPETGRNLLSQFQEKVEAIVWKAIGLHKTVSEDITSVELATYISPCDTLFDSSQMEVVEEEDSDEVQSDRIICTVGMGLRCKTINGSKGLGEWDVALKSKVVLVTLEVET